MKDYTSTQLEPDKIYHLYNRANGNELLFVVENNYVYFLKQLKKFISPIATTYCYCLMPNHVHFLLQLKNEQELEKYFIEKYQGQYESTFRKFETFGKLVSKEFSNFFSSYAQAFNKQQNRKGNLFMHKFKRLEVKEEPYLRKLIHYIHSNLVEAGLCKHPRDWNFSSYKAIISEKETLVDRKTVIQLFDDKANFIYTHLYPQRESGINQFEK